jgi:hemoglobin
MSQVEEHRSLYDITGNQFFIDLVDAFYDGLETDPVLISLYPEGKETTGARHRFALFLIQYWGGPTTYMDERGHPRLRMRHNPFAISALERDHWLMHMATAIEQTLPSVAEDDREHVTSELANYFVHAAEAMRNR